MDANEGLEKTKRSSTTKFEGKVPRSGDLFFSNATAVHEVGVCRYKAIKRAYNVSTKKARAIEARVGTIVTISRRKVV
jgi:hypothetical protein